MNSKSFLSALLALLCSLPILGQSFPLSPYSPEAVPTERVPARQSSGFVQATSERTPGADSFGVQDLTVVALTSFAFDPITSDVTYDWFDGLIITSAGGVMVADLQVPHGAVLVAIELEACDSDVFTEVTLGLLKCGVTPGICESIATVGTGETEDPGCGLFYLNLPVQNEVVDTVNYSYFVDVTTGPFGDTRLRSARVGYRRQISPAPAFATFADVPTTHPLHQYVEALKSSGITGGCGDGTNFCPNDPVTRGQMAVFLAKALGLHWAP